MTTCRVCDGPLQQFLDLGAQPLSDAFRLPGQADQEFFFPLAVASCPGCTMVQLTTAVPRDQMFGQDYPYHSSGSATMRAHFEATAVALVDPALAGPDPFVVEIGSNDGVMLHALADAGVRHLGVEPSGRVAEVARSRGARVRTAYFEEATAREVAAAEGPADVVYAANTICHIPYLDSVFRGLEALLAPSGVFVFEDPYLGDIVERTSFDQIYDEHFYLFSVRSVQQLALRSGFELVDVARLPVHGGECRYTLARRGARRPAAAVGQALARETAAGLAEIATLRRFAARVERIRTDLTALLGRLSADGSRVVAYGATAKSATVTNFCGLGQDEIAFVCDSTPAKQGRVTPGAHIPVRPPDAFRDPFPDYAVLFAWNHAGEIMAKEREFRAAGGRWILYVPDVHIV